MYRRLICITATSSAIMPKQMKRLSSTLSSDPAWCDFLKYQSNLLSLESKKVNAAFDLLQEGCSVPFISRYRRQETGDLPAEVIFSLSRSLEAFTNLVKTRENRLKKLADKGKLDETLRIQFESCIEIEKLDDLWEPYKEKKAGKAQKARCIPGLQALATSILSGAKLDISFTIQSINLSPDAEMTVMEGIQAIISDEVAHDPRYSSSDSEVYKTLYRSVTIQSSFPSGLTEADRASSKYLNYDAFQRLINEIQPHQILALRRGKENDQLAVKVAPSQYSSDNVIKTILHHYGVNPEIVHADINKLNQESRDVIIYKSVSKAVTKSICAVVARKAWTERLKSAEEEAVMTFARNLRHLLLTPPLSSFARDAQVVAGLDPGISNGHKLAILAAGGSEILARDRLFSFDAGRRRDSVQRFRNLCMSLKVNVVAIGDGVGCSEAQDLVAEALEPLPEVRFAVVSEVGASVYSVSTTAKAEFPNEDISYLGSTSIARRLVDPLSELVKIPPQALGIGMYQHDIEEKVLQRRLGETVEQCVNDVGADVNTASEHVLKYVSGMNEARARAVVSHRAQSGPFDSRSSLMKVKGIGAVTFLNAAGFLRVQGGLEPLDGTCVHPEQYSLARRLWQRVTGQRSITHDGLEDKNAIKKAFSNCDWATLSVELGEAAEVLRGVAQLLGASPGDGEADVRRHGGGVPQLRRRATSVQNVVEGAELEGVVTNIATFGAFVGLGGGRTGLLHKSSPGVSQVLPAVTVGQRIRVRVASIDSGRERISLSIPMAEQASVSTTVSASAYVVGKAPSTGGGDATALRLKRILPTALDLIGHVKSDNYNMSDNKLRSNSDVNDETVTKKIRRHK